jgi:ferredoxin
LAGRLGSVKIPYEWVELLRERAQTTCAREGTGEIMAERSKRIPDNVAGSFYVDRECIDCDLCRETAPENFQRNEDEGFSYVYKQPVRRRRASSLPRSAGQLSRRGDRQRRR